MKRYSLSLVGFGIAISVLLITLIFEIDLFEAVTALLEGHEAFEADEFVIPVLIFIGFAYVDQMGRLKRQRLDREKIKIYKAMLASTHHILNNFLNQVQLFKITAEATPGFDPNVLAVYEQVIKDAVTQIDALGSISKIDEEEIRASVAPG